MKQLKTSLVLLIVGGVLTTIDLFWAFWRSTVVTFVMSVRKVRLDN